MYTSKFRSHRFWLAIQFVVFITVFLACSVKGHETLVYHYTYPYSQAEDNYLKLNYEKGCLLDGLFCATSDEIDEAREGYPCGFFALPLNHIACKGDTIYFTVDIPSGKKCFSKDPFLISSAGRLISPPKNEPWENAEDWYRNYSEILSHFGFSEIVSLRYKMSLKGDSLELYNLTLPYDTEYKAFTKMTP